MKIGFTGTRVGMTRPQFQAVKGLLEGFGLNATLHHGGAKGADHEAWGIARNLELKTVRHSSNLSHSQAVTKDDETHIAKPPLERNRDIVDACDVLIVAPIGEEITRSGTWSTARYARKCDKPRVIVYKDGRVEWEKRQP